MKYHLCIVWMLVMICSPLGWVNAQEFQPPAWSVGDWWIVKSQRYDSGETVDEERQPRWLPTQTWRFDVEKQETIANQLYFVVAIHPAEGQSMSVLVSLLVQKFGSICGTLRSVVCEIFHNQTPKLRFICGAQTV